MVHGEKDVPSDDVDMILIPSPHPSQGVKHLSKWGRSDTLYHMCDGRSRI